PADAQVFEPGSGNISPAGENRSAMTKVTYRVVASGFQDRVEMDTADLIYPYVLAYRWGAGRGITSDAEIASATQPLREHFKAIKVTRVEKTRLAVADLTFEYSAPIVEVYLDVVSAVENDNALVAPPWSTVPWHVLALMEAAVER